MEYRLLINSKNSPADDFYIYSKPEVKCLCTSGSGYDINAHVSVFNPQAYVCYYEKSDEEMLGQFRTIDIDERFSNTLLVVIADKDACNELSEKLPSLNALVLIKPVTIVSLEEQIIQHLDEKPAQTAESETPSEPPAPVFPTSDELDSLYDKLMYEFKTTAPPSPQAPVPVQKKRILVIDDDRSVLKMLKDALGAEYDVTAMANGKMVDKYLETNKGADLILLDYEMPEVSGPDVLKSLRSNPRSKDIPVVFLTGVADSDKIRVVLALNPNGYMLKPINIDKLRKTIKDFVG